MTAIQYSRFRLILDFQNFCIQNKYHLVKVNGKVNYYSFNDQEFFSLEDVYNKFIATNK